MTSSVNLTDIRFAYGTGSPILEDVTCEFASGGIHAVTGPSGCGKSTLLYIAGLMLRPRNGRVRMLGIDHENASDRDRARFREEFIGFVFQDALLDPSLTVRENIAEGFPWRNHRRLYRRNAEHQLERVGLTALVDRRAAHLSGGQAQRVALVRALAKQPKIVLADEPTGNLDPDSAKIVFETIADYGRKPEKICIVVTHDQRLADRCDTVTRLGPAATDGFR